MVVVAAAAGGACVVAAVVEATAGAVVDMVAGCWLRRENVVVGLAGGVPKENAVVAGPLKLKLNGVVVISPVQRGQPVILVGNSQRFGNSPVKTEHSTCAV